MPYPDHFSFSKEPVAILAPTQESSSRQGHTYFETARACSFPHVLRGCDAWFSADLGTGDIRLNVPHVGTISVSFSIAEPPSILLATGGHRSYISYHKSPEHPQRLFPRIVHSFPGAPSQVVVEPTHFFPGISPNETVLSRTDFDIVTNTLPVPMMRRMHFRHGEHSSYEHGVVQMAFTSHLSFPNREMFVELAIPRALGCSLEEQVVNRDLYLTMEEALQMASSSSSEYVRHHYNDLAIEAADRFMSRFSMLELTEL